MLKDFTMEKFDVIIQGGQSNSNGTGHGDAKPFYEPNDRTWYLWQDFTISTARERVVGNHISGDFSLEFARRYIESGRLKDGRGLLIIRAAVGATGFCDKRWGLKDDLFLQMIEMIKTALSLNGENRLIAFLWHQGEADANKGHMDFNTHYNNLITLVRAVREMFSAEWLPFIAGDFVPLWKKNRAEISEPVSRAVRAVCSDLKHAAFVETDGLKSNFEEYGPEADGREDIVHFSRAALYRLGSRYYDAFMNIN